MCVNNKIRVNNNIPSYCIPLLFNIHIYFMVKLVFTTATENLRAKAGNRHLQLQFEAEVGNLNLAYL